MKPTRARATTRLAAIAVVAVLGASACESQPSARRVAEDMVRSLPGATEDQRQCMLDKIDEYSQDELQDIGSGVTDGDPDAEAALRRFESDLADCR